MLTSRRPPTNSERLVAAGPAIASEGLQVSKLVTTHGGLVGGLLVRLQDARVLEDLRSVAPQVAQGVGGLLCGPLRIPRLYRLACRGHAPLQAVAYFGWSGVSHHSQSQSGSCL